ncbi:MAG: PPC domain-containing DNA-binding protein [Thermoprotei archaeon]
MVIGGSGRVIVVRLNEGADVEAEIKEAMKSSRVDAALIIGIGSFSYSKIGWFDSGSGSYKETEINQLVEVAPMVGNYVLSGDKPFLHIHVNLGAPDRTWSGHLLAARVGVNLEVFATEISGVPLARSKDKKFGLEMLDA